MTPRKALGAASDYYRVRIMHVDDSDTPDFEWRDDILWRRPTAVQPGEYEVWRVEAVGIDDDEDVTVIGVFEARADAEEASAAAAADILDLTRSQFEERYFPPSD
jgi:hypothetical protein